MSVDLNFTAYGEGGPGAPLVIAHGLYGSSRNWAGLAKRYAAGRPVFAVDMRNHGDSPWSDEVGYEAMASDLAAFIDRHADGRADLIGHSMGGKAAMMLALKAAHRLRSLIVADIAPVAYDHSHLGYLKAMRGVDLSAVARRADADAALAPLIPEAPLRGFILQNLVLGGDGPRWRLNIAAIERSLSALMGFPAPDGAKFEGPTLFLRGGASDYVAPTSETVIRDLFPAARIETLPGAAHWLHAEQPDQFLAATTAFLDEVTQ